MREPCQQFGVLGKIFFQANVLGTKYVLEACRQTGIQRLVYVSSPSIYAAPKDQLAIKEVMLQKKIISIIISVANWLQRSSLKIIQMFLVLS